MKTYLRISSLVFLLVGVAHTMRIVLEQPLILGDTAIPEGVSWATAAVSYLMFLFGFGLSFTFGRRDLKMQKREEEISSLVAILQDGRDQQAVVLETLQSQALIEGAKKQFSKKRVQALEVQEPEEDKKEY